jgi:O-antigen ligase
MVGVAAFALMTSVSHVAALATAGGLVLCAGAARNMASLPRLGLFAVVALVPLSFLGAQVSAGGMNSLTKLVFLPALAVLAAEGILARRPVVLGKEGLFTALFALALAVSYLVNDATPLSQWFLSRFAGVMLLFVLTANALRTERDVAHLFVVVVVSCLCSVLGSLVAPVNASPNAFWNGTMRMTGWAIADAPTFGTNVLVALLICVYFAFVIRRFWTRLALVAIAGALAIAVVQTYARGIALVLLLSLGYMLFRIRKRVNVFLALMALLLVGLCAAPLIPSAFYERMSGVVNGADDPTMNRRIASYLIGLELFAQHPIVGFGPGSFPVRYMEQEFRFLRTGGASGCFNLYLSVGTQAGLFGLACLAGLLWSSMRSLRFVATSGRRDDDGLETDTFLGQAAEATEIVLVALLLISFFEPTDLQKYLWVFVGVAASLSAIRRGQSAARLKAAEDARQ